MCVCVYVCVRACVYVCVGEWGGGGGGANTFNDFLFVYQQINSLLKKK